jgi:hypothetical protein
VRVDGMPCSNVESSLAIIVDVRVTSQDGSRRIVVTSAATDTADADVVRGVVDETALRLTMAEDPPQTWPQAPPAHEETKDTVWYGWQTLAVILATTAPFGISAATAGTSAGGASFAFTTPLAAAGLLMGGPIVHWAHGHIGRGFGVLGAELGVGTLGALIGGGLMVAGGGGGGDLGGLAVVAVGCGVGVLGIMIVNIVDVATSFEERPRASATISPTVSVQRGGGTVGLTGAF